MDSERKGKSGPVVAKVAPVSAVRWAGQAGWSWSIPRIGRGVPVSHGTTT